ncbi:MAG TPA: Rab family GTPase [Candidatus Lokiarchaeia archaeon]|nr:Rab family GTPase [Candidatus Lokiarchaeia archaeon]
MVDKEPDYVFKIAVVGDYAVGKTSLISRFIQRKFLKEYKPTLGVNLILKELEITDKDENPLLCNLVLWDIAGQERYASVRKLYYKGCSAAMLVYDVTRMDTFNNLETTWLKDYTENTVGDRVFVIIGNKADLEDIRKVSTQDGEDLKDRIGAVQFLETSAKDGTNVDDAFMNLVHILLDKSNEKK